MWVKGTVEQRLFLQQELEGPFRVTHIFVHVSNIGTARVGPSLSEVFVWIKKTCREGGSCLIGCWSLLTILEQPKISGKKRCQEKCSFCRRCQIDALPVQIVCPRFTDRIFYNVLTSSTCCLCTIPLFTCHFIIILLCNSMINLLIESPKWNPFKIHRMLFNVLLPINTNTLFICSEQHFFNPLLAGLKCVHSPSTAGWYRGVTMNVWHTLSQQETREDCTPEESSKVKSNIRHSGKVRGAQLPRTPLDAVY